MRTTSHVLALPAPAPARRRAPRLLALIAGIGFLAEGCGDPGFEPAPVNLRLVIITTGVDKDADGYFVHGAGAPLRIVQADAELSLSVSAGEYEIRIDGIAPNCALQSPASVSVSVAAGATTTATFNLQCRAVTASIEVVAPTAGRDFDADGYVVVVNDIARTVVYSGDSVLVEGLPAGTSTVSLGGFSDNCALSGGPGSVDVQLSVGEPIRDVRRVVFEITCQATTGDVQLTTITHGTSRDPDGYTILVDGALVTDLPCDPYGYYCPPSPLRLHANGSHILSAPPGEHTYQLADLYPGCAVEGTNPRTASVAIGAVAELVFTVACS